MDVAFLLLVLIWVVKIGADIDELRAKHIEFLASRIMVIRFSH